MLLTRQFTTLLWKNIAIVLFRHPFSTPLRCFILPVIFVAFLAYARNLFIPPSEFGIGDSTTLRSLPDALRSGGGGRNTVALVNNGFVGGDIERVINNISSQVQEAGKTAQILTREDDLLTTCRSTIRGVSPCFGAAVFYSSPQEGDGGLWNYTLRVDGGLGIKIVVTQTDNDVEIYPLPLQHAVDFAIASQNTTIDQSALPGTVQEYPFTSESKKERSARIRIRYMGGIIDILGVAFFIGIVGVIYQFVGLVSTERELGITQLIDASLPNKRRWEPQMVRFLACHVAFDLMFLPGWIVIALILGIGIFAKTSMGAIIIFHILTGLSLSSFSLFGAAFFHKAQLSGIITTIASLLLAVLAQVVAKASTGAIVILAILFPPMNYTFFTILMARWERQDRPTNLVQPAPENPSTLPGIAFFIFAIIQTLAFPILGAFIEKFLYGTTSRGRKLTSNSQQSGTDVSIENLTKRYFPSWWANHVSSRFGRKKETVVAVEDLTLRIPQGQIMVLLGANGSGKSTTLDCIAGLRSISAGNIAVDGVGGIGITPQANVLWAKLTTYEHVWIFNRLKSIEKPADKSELSELIKDCDLTKKTKTKSSALSGGQKRKLQLAMMFAGGSRVCCVDEASSGVDPLARRSLWNILLRERGKRTLILTTHFLDEADLLSDQIAILSKGRLKAVGSSVDLKHELGGGFRVHVFKDHSRTGLVPPFEDAQKKEHVDQTVYTLPSSIRVADFIRWLDNSGVKNYEISSPTVEEIFFNVAEASEVEAGGLVETSKSRPSSSLQETNQTTKEDSSLEKRPSQREEVLQLQTGEQITALQQGFALFVKRWTVFQRNYLPYAAAFLIPVIAAGLVTLFLKGFTTPGCSPAAQISRNDIESLLSQQTFELVAGPSNRLSTGSFDQIESSLPGGGNMSTTGSSGLVANVHTVDDLDGFNNYVKQNYRNITPGGFFLGDERSPPTFAYKGNGDISLAVITQNAFDTLLTNISISTQYQAFDTPWSPSTGKTLQLIVYFGLTMAAYPAFFSLYPTLERLRHVRQLHYSNGVRSSSLWLAYLLFDFIFVLATSVLAIVIFRAVTSTWYHIEYLFVVLLLYGVASTLLSYVISLFSRSQLAAFAFSAGGQAVMFLLYFIAYLSVFTYAQVDKVDSDLQLTHFVFSLVTPTGSLIRALFVSLNVFSTTCNGKTYIISYPGAIQAYGGPILYLIVQSLFLFGVLLWWDSGSIWARFRRNRHKVADKEETLPLDDEVAAEVKRVQTTTSDGLRVEHITKSFGKKVLAVDDVTFGVKRGEVFALLGPNGAGKSTVISLIRGDILPAPSSGDIYVEDIPVSKRRSRARNRLGVCPQFDCCDQMDVRQHLAFYARIRGVNDVQRNVESVLHAVGLEPYQTRMAAKLSGGNKRKLSLAIALMGNPSVLLLDEPSSGMDVCAKRVMWRTLASVVPGRSLVLTTHSMEEADALADRAGIMGGRMLALGTSQDLRRRHGDRYYVHLVMRSAPHSTDSEMENVRQWIGDTFEGSEVEDRTFHGQVRFSVPAAREGSGTKNGQGFRSPESGRSEIAANIDKDAITSSGDISEKSVIPATTAAAASEDTSNQSGISALFTLLEAHKSELGFEYYSVSPTTLDQVFLSIVSKHKVEEENYDGGRDAAGNGTGRSSRRRKWLGLRRGGST